MLVFIDESYTESSEGHLYHALAGFGIGEAEYRRLVAALYQLKLEFFEDARHMSREDRAQLRTTRIASAGDPRSAELKATKLLTAKAARYHEETGEAASLLLVEKLLSTVRELRGTVFGVLSEPPNLEPIQRPSESIPKQYRYLIERIDAWSQAEHAGDFCHLIFDQIDGKTSKQLNRTISDFLFRHGEGIKMKSIVPTPFWVDSDSTAGSQVADIIAHVLMNSMLPPSNRKPLSKIWDAVRALEFQDKNSRMRGIRRLRK